jgi:hypothetical protein
MTRDQIKAVLDRVLTWPPDRRADVAQVAALMEQDKRALRLHCPRWGQRARRLISHTTHATPSAITRSVAVIQRLRRASMAITPWQVTLR